MELPTLLSTKDGSTPTKARIATLLTPTKGNGKLCKFLNEILLLRLEKTSRYPKGPFPRMTALRPDLAINNYGKGRLNALLGVTCRENPPRYTIRN